MSAQSNQLDSILTRARQVATNIAVVTIALVLASFLLYWRTAAPTVLPGDSGELQFAAWGFWLAHPTGYPLYLILGGAWQHLVQIGDPAFRLNLFSAFCAALAVGVAFLVFWSVTRARGASAIAALTFAVSPLFWSQATRAEVYALNTLFVALLTLWAVLWRANPQRKYMLAFAVTFGLALTHHRTTILLLPAFAALFADKWLIAKSNPTAFGKRALLYAALAALPLLLYLYIPLRAGATPYATLDVSPAPPIVIFENSPRGWLNVILGSGFSGALGVDDATLAALRNFPTQWLIELNPLGILFSVFGLVVLAGQKKFALAAFVLYGGLTLLLFNSVYHIGDIADYFTPIYFFSSLAIAAFIAFVVTQLRTFHFTRAGILPTILLLGCLAALPLQNLSNNFFTQDHSRQFDARKRWAALFASDLPDNAILLSNDRDEMTPLYYLQLVEKQHPAWLGIFPKIAAGADYDNVVSLVQRVAASARPIYAIKPLPALTLRYQIEQGENDLWLVKPIGLLPPQNPGDALIGNALRAKGYSLIAGQNIAGERITLAIQLQVLKPLVRDYTSSLQLFDANDNKVAQGNDHVPGQGEYPSSKWRVGETIQDQFDIELDPNLEAGDYSLMLRFYDPSSGDELGDLVKVGTIGLTK